jgi:alpha-beta hydrolase superfamily lysophospholipase
LGETAAPYTVETHTAGDGYRWRLRRYDPPGSPRAHVVGIHGIQSHAGWYEHSCTALSRAGFAVYFIDRRGSGMNEGARGDAPGFRRLLDDLAEFLRTLRDGPRRPVFLAAISWGGKLAAALPRRHPGLVDGLALLCPGFYPRVKPPFRQRLNILWSRLVRPRKLFPVPLNDPELFTATPGWQQFIRDDPLGLRRVTARFLIESVRLDGYLRFVPKHVRLPVLLLLAEHDRIIKNDKTRRLLERFASADKEEIEYPGAHHTLEFEPDPGRFIEDLRDWLERKTKILTGEPGASATGGGEGSSGR